MKFLLSVFIITLCFSACSQRLQNEKSADASLPKCINKLISDFKSEPKQNPPRKIFSYTYHDSTVYYVQPICCDFYSDLYDNKCNLIAHPDGGFTGKGDGKIKDFRKEATNEKLVWEDTRK